MPDGHRRERDRARLATTSRYSRGSIASARPPPGFAALDAAFVRFTSGTTADAKGVILSHGDVVARVAAADAVLRLGPDDRVLWTLPLAYHFAVTITAYVRAGCARAALP